METSGSLGLYLKVLGNLLKRKNFFLVEVWSLGSVAQSQDIRLFRNVPRPISYCEHGVEAAFEAAINDSYELLEVLETKTGHTVDAASEVASSHLLEFRAAGSPFGGIHF